MESKGCQDILTRIKQFTAKPEFVKIAVIAGFAGIALILFSGMFSGKKTQNDTKALTEAGQTKYISLTEYENGLEQSLAEIISSINGAGSTKVMLTMESTVEQVFAENKNMSQNSSNNTRQQSDTVNNSDVTAQSSYITLELSDGSQQTVLLKEIQPRVRGVLIVCSGGDNEVVKAKITDAVTKALDISSSRVSVAGLAQ